MTTAAIDEFLRPLAIDSRRLRMLLREFRSTFRQLAADSPTQFLPTPIFESTLRPCPSQQGGVYLAIDIGGTNLRVAFVKLFPGGIKDEQQRSNEASSILRPGLRRLYEKAWPILDIMKNERADELFDWVGSCISEVVRDAVLDGFELPFEIPMGVAFSFPMAQESLTHATLMGMGKGFALASNLDIGSQLMNGYETYRRFRRNPSDVGESLLPPIRITAILNDAVATMVSFMYQNPETPEARPAMGLILGTGANATIPMRASYLHETKRKLKLLATIDEIEDVDKRNPKIAVNTEWSISGTAAPLRKLGLITRWDEHLSANVENPGFQPLEYMTAGRYLGELCRLIFVDYMLTECGVSATALPKGMQTKFGVTTTFLSFYRPYDRDGGVDKQGKQSSLLEQLECVYPTADVGGAFAWTADLAEALYQITLAVERRAAFIMAAAIIGLVQSADYLPFSEGNADAVVPASASAASANGAAAGKSTHIKDVMVGYTGGCITKFQTYLDDTRKFLAEGLALEYGAEGSKNVAKILMLPCHDGGIEGAGILAGVSGF